MIEELRTVIKQMHYVLEVMLLCVRWYVAYLLTSRHLEEVMSERGVAVGHVTVRRQAVQVPPVLAALFRRRKCPVGTSWTMDELHQGRAPMKVHVPRGRRRRTHDRFSASHQGRLYCDSMRCGACDRLAPCFREDHVDQGGANTAAILSVNVDSGAGVELRQSKYPNNIVEHDHRAIKRIVRPPLGLKCARCTRVLLAGIELMHMIKKDQLDRADGQSSCAASKLHPLAF